MDRPIKFKSFTQINGAGQKKLKKLRGSWNNDRNRYSPINKTTKLHLHI